MRSRYHPDVRLKVLATHINPAFWSSVELAIRAHFPEQSPQTDEDYHWVVETIYNRLIHFLEASGYARTGFEEHLELGRKIESWIPGGFQPRQVFFIGSTIYFRAFTILHLFHVKPSPAPPQCLRPAAHVQHNDPLKCIKNINTCL